MSPTAFEAACRELFRSWDRVATFAGPDEFVVRLHVSDRRLAAARTDVSRYLGQLFDHARLEDLAKRIERNARMRGLRRYGRKRR